MMATASLCGVAMSLLGGWLSDHTGTRMVGSAGMLCIAAGLAMMGLLNAESSLAEAALWVSLTGAGNGLVQAACYSLVMRSVRPERFGTAGAMLSLTQALGSIFAIVILGGIFALREDHHLAQLAGTAGAEAAAFLKAYRDVFMMGAAVGVLGALVAAFGRAPHGGDQIGPSGGNPRRRDRSRGREGHYQTVAVGHGLGVAVEALHGR